MNDNLKDAIAAEIEEDGIAGLSQTIIAACEEGKEPECPVRWQLDCLIAILEERYKLFV